MASAEPVCRCRTRPISGLNDRVGVNGSYLGCYHLQTWSIRHSRVPELAPKGGTFDAATERDASCAGLQVLAGRARFNAGDIKGAIAVFEKAAALRPECADAFAWLLGPGAVSDPWGDLHSGDSKARRALDARLRKDPACWWAWALRGLAFSDGPHDRERRKDDLRRAAALAPESGWVLAYLGRQLRTDAPREALTWLDRAAARLPGAGWVRAWRGHLKARLGDKAGARRDLDAAIKLDPWYPTAYAWRGVLRRDLSDLQTAVRLDPRYAYGAQQLALLLAERGDTAGGVREMTRALLLDPGPARSLARSEKSLSELSAQRPQEPLVRLWLGEARLRAGDAAGARTELEAFLQAAGKRAPGALLAWAGLWRAEALAAQGRRKEALEAARRAQKQEPHCGRRALALIGAFSSKKAMLA